MIEYEINRELLKTIMPSQLETFENDFKNVSDLSIKLEFQPRGYNVNNQIVESKIQTISFFSGAGGLDIGAQLAGSQVISSLDFDRDSVLTMQSNPYFKNTQHLHNDITTIKSCDYSKILSKQNPEKLILIGGPPCQPFSKAGYWVTHENRLGSEDPRNMIGQYLRLISELKPDGFLLENVESLLHPKNINAVREMEETIDKLGYKLLVYKANALEFGVPQKRKRVFFIASRKNIDTLPNPTHGSDLEILLNPNLKAYERAVDWIGKYDHETFFEQEELTTGKTYDEALKQIPPGKNYFALTDRNGHPNPQFEANKRFWNFLLKLHPNQPSWTIAAQPGPWVGPFHWNSRRLRVPEIAALQTFPEDYKFVGSRRSIQKQIGNAVPPILGKAVIEHLIKFI